VVSLGVQVAVGRVTASSRQERPMPVSPTYRTYILNSFLTRHRDRPSDVRRLGLYHDGRFFGLVDDDTPT
jgi:hypothetical protein